MEAPSTALKVGDTGAYAITKGVVVDLKDVCPNVPGGITCQAVGSYATVSLSLNGCVDTLGNVAHRLNMLGNGKAEIIVSAIGIANEVSMRSRCAAMPTSNTDLYITDLVTKDNLTLDFLK